MEDLRRFAASSTERPAFTHHVQRVQGKIRNIAVPNWGMRLLHWQLIERLRKIQVGALLQNSYGAMRGSSPVANASRHAHSQHIYQLDITQAYASVPLQALADTLFLLDYTLGSQAEIEVFLRTYCAGAEGGLAVGGPASPILFDLYCASEIDSKIKAACPRAIYTRYHDDITISQDEPIPRIMRRRIRDAVEESGLSVSHHKSFLTNRFEQSVTITGVVITRWGSIRPTSEFMAKAQEAAKLPVEQMTKQERDSLRGIIGHLSQFTGPLEWPYPEVARDVKNLERQLLTKSWRIRKPARRGEARRFSPRFLWEINQLPIEEVVRPYVQKYRKFGKEYIGLCPYHIEKTPSFTVAPDKGFYHCFGCSAHGDVITFVMDFEKRTFVDAVRSLAARYGISEY